MTFDEALVLWEKFAGQTRYDEVVELYNSVLSTPPGAVVEVGSAKGGTTIILISAAEKVNKIVYSVDPYPEEMEKISKDYKPGIMKSFKQSFKHNILTGQWKNIIQYNEDISSCIDKIPDKLSVVFIDGCHEYSNVLNEFQMLSSKLVNGGMMFIHDVHVTKGQASNIDGTGVDKIAELFSNKFSNVKKIELTLYGTKK